MYSDEESYLWYTRQLLIPCFGNNMPKEFIAAFKAYCTLVLHMQRINNK